jgi:hypothetical protein
MRNIITAVCLLALLPAVHAQTAKDQAAHGQCMRWDASTGKCVEHAVLPKGYHLLKEQAKGRQDPGSAYVRDVVHQAHACSSKGGDLMDCYLDASPSRCKQATIHYVSHPELGMRTWSMCVRSCARAGFMSRTFGSCRR